ncbi:MAG: hypothetical protein IH614_19770 [Desulfuromonadales bacterium]|nr:hypothetical protein [Desulfuromonadales bacterium]
MAAVAQGVNGGYYRDVGTSVIQIYRTTQAEADAVSLGSDVRIINTSTGQSVSFKVASRNYAGGVYRLIGGSVVGALDNKNVTDAWAGSITMSEQVVRQSKTLLHCDIIGDPANYPQAWKDNGVAGTPLLVAEDGVTSLIPDGTSKPYKLSRKLRGAGVLMALLSTDGGITWVDTTSTVNGLFSTTTNSWTALYSTGRILLAFYLTEASPLELATNAEVLSLGDVWAGNAFNRPLIGYFVGKISTLSTLPSYSTADSVHVNRRPVFGASDGKIYGTGNYGNDPAHPTLNIQASATPAAKALPYITRANGKLYLQALYKEMRHNGTSWGDDAKFSVVDNESTTTDLNAATIKIGQKRLELPFFIADGE